jgi:hypothetical protein
MKEPVWNQTRLLLGTLVALMGSDGVITRFLVANKLCFESNIFIRRWVLEDSFLLIKMVGGLLCALILWDIYRRRPLLAHKASSLAVLTYTGIVYWNIFLLFSVYIFNLIRPS